MVEIFVGEEFLYEVWNVVFVVKVVEYCDVWVFDVVGDFGFV